MNRNKILITTVLATFLMFPLLALAEVPMEFDDWNSDDLARIGSAERIDNNNFMLRGRITIECRDKSAGFKISADPSSGAFKIHDPVPTKAQKAQGLQTVRECMKAPGIKCDRDSCVSLAHEGGVLNLAGLDKTDATVHLEADEEGVPKSYSLSGNMDHKSQKTATAEKHQAEYDRLVSTVKNCKGDDRLSAGQILYRRHEISSGQMDAIKASALRDELKDLEKAAKNGSLDDQGEVLDRLLKFGSDNETKYAKKVAQICATIAGRYTTEQKNSDGFASAHETLDQCATIDGLSKSDQLTVARYHDDVSAAEIKNLSKQGLQGGAFIPAFETMQQSLAQRYQDACYGDEINPDACNSVMNLSNKMDGFYQDAAVADQRRQQLQYQNQMRRQQALMGGNGMGGMGGNMGYSSFMGNPAMNNSSFGSPMGGMPGYGGGGPRF